MLQKIENEFSHHLFGHLTVITSDSNEVFFISNEVSSILDYSANKKLLERLDEDEKIPVSHSEAKALLSGYDVHSSGIQLLTESGLYSAVLGSKKPEAKEFKKWITSEVLPTIRKTGVYYTENATTKPLSQLDILAQAIVALQGQEARITSLEERAEHVELRLAEPAVVALLGVPAPSDRQKIEAIVAGYTKATHGDYRENWNLLYSRLYLHYRVKIKNYKRNKGQTWLDVAEEKGYCEKLLAVATKYFSI